MLETTTTTNAAPPRASDAVLRSTGRQDWATWPHYDAAVLGLQNYWYPVMWARDLGSRPVSRTLFGERIMFIRDRGKPYALHDRCPHRGVPLSLGAGWLGERSWSRQEFPGTLSCGYHGWTYDLASGNLVAALTDGPDSPICGKVRVKTYPVAERVGLVWIYYGELAPPPVEADIPTELLQWEDAGHLVHHGVISVKRGNWRFAAENGIDESHPRYLHRYAPWMFPNYAAGWTRTHLEWLENGRWLTYARDAVHYESHYPGLGSWPRKRWWQRRPPTRKSGIKAGTIGIALPGVLRIQFADWATYEWYIPMREHEHLHIRTGARGARGRAALGFTLWYQLYVRQLQAWAFYNQDALMIAAVDAPPERLFRPDAAIVGWRKLCETARGAPGAAAPAAEAAPTAALAEAGRG
jgi:phenylpropionate dioxygenase-like ring-hydroxylating dioxygenase large terminal subunit